jgi:hypothetical protein
MLIALLSSDIEAPSATRDVMPIRSLGEREVCSGECRQLDVSEWQKGQEMGRKSKLDQLKSDASRILLLRAVLDPATPIGELCDALIGADEDIPSREAVLQYVRYRRLSKAMRKQAADELAKLEGKPQRCKPSTAIAPRTPTPTAAADIKAAPMRAEIIPTVDERAWIPVLPDGTILAPDTDAAIEISRKIAESDR